MAEKNKKSRAVRNLRVICAMSGGVDSSVSAALLKKQGYDVTGVFMKCWQDAPCSAEEDERWARRAAAKIGIPFYSVDLVAEYKKRVFDYFIAEYMAGRTPNPDVMCNREIKFGVFFDWAVNDFEADYIATGHYARLRQKTPASNFQFPKLLKGRDLDKDQSYFLWAVEQEKFKRVIFPVGDYRKSEVRAMAKKLGLPNAARKDSQGVCFVGEFSMGIFLREYINDKPGPVINLAGEEVGEHRGLHFYTIGQRRGIEIGGGPPYYVAQKDFAHNALIVAREYDRALLRDELVCTNISWFADSLPVRCRAKVRYRQEDQSVMIEQTQKSAELRVKFLAPQRAITSGQSIVFYRGQELIGGGVIN